MVELIKIDSPQNTEPAPELENKSVGDFDISKKWKTLEDVQNNIAGLPEKVKKILKTEQAISPEEQKRNLWEKFFKKPTLEEMVDEIIKNRKIAKVILSDHLFEFLFKSGWHGHMTPDSDKSGMRLEGQWAERLKRGEKDSFIEEEILKFMDGFWQSETTPYVSVKELKEYQSGFNAESERLASQCAKRMVAETDLGLKITVERKKRAQEKMAEELRKMQSDKRKDELTAQYGDNERRGNTNYINLENARFIEKLFKKLKPKLSQTEYVELWLDAIQEVYNNKVKEAAFRGAMSYLEKEVNGSEVIGDNSILREQKIKMLAGQFANTLEQLRHAKEMGRDAEASAEHARFILRAILQLLEKQK